MCVVEIDPTQAFALLEELVISGKANSSLYFYDVYEGCVPECESCKNSERWNKALKEAVDYIDKYSRDKP